MRRRLLSRKWLALHALLIVCLLSFSLLGKWQFTRAESVDGTIRNIAYALQWWIFAGFAIFFWWKILRSDLAEDRGGTGSAGSSGSARAAGSAGNDGKPAAFSEGLSGRGGDVAYEPAPAVEILDESDPEDAALIAYNRYLAQLNEGHERARSG